MTDNYIKEYLGELKERLEKLFSNYWFDMNAPSVRTEVKASIKTELERDKLNFYKTTIITHKYVNFDYDIICDDTNNPPVIVDENIIIADIIVSFNNKIEIFITRLTIGKKCGATLGKFFEHFETEIEDSIEYKEVIKPKPDKRINIVPKDKFKPFRIPEYATPGSSGLDLYSANEETIGLLPGEFKLIDTNICIEMPEGVEAQVRSRSGLALKNGIFVLNGIGSIDSDYRNSIGVILANFSQVPFNIAPMTKIAQLVFANVLKVNLELVEELSDTERGQGGFGSTGI